MASPGLLEARRPCALSTRCHAVEAWTLRGGPMFALHREGYSHMEIEARVMHGRGCEAVSLASVGAVVRRVKADACWVGDANAPAIG